NRLRVPGLLVRPRSLLLPARLLSLLRSLRLSGVRLSRRAGGLRRAGGAAVARATAGAVVVLLRPGPGVLSVRKGMRGGLAQGIAPPAGWLEDLAARRALPPPDTGSPRRRMRDDESDRARRAGAPGHGQDLGAVQRRRRRLPAARERAPGNYCVRRV